MTHPETVQSAFSVIVPCYNERGAISDVVDSLVERLQQIGPCDVIVVNDGSTDGTDEILEEVRARHPQVRVERHLENRGYGAALKTGIRRARTEFVAIIDADGSYPIARLPELLASAADADMVVAMRTADDVTYPLIRKIPKFFLVRYASWIAGERIPDLNSGMRVMRKSVVEKFMAILPNGFSFTTTITLAMLTNQYIVRYIPIGYAPRVGRSKIRPIRDTLNFFQLILRTGMYFAPLKVFLPLALALGIGLVVSVIWDVFVYEDITDKTLLLLLFCLNTLMFGLLSDMIDKRSPK